MADTKLVDLAYSKAEQKEEQSEYVRGEAPAYPWGLCISLEKRELDKLGIAQLPPVGVEVTFTAVAVVTSVNQSARQGEDEESRVGLQITQLQVAGIESPAEEKTEGKQTPAKEARESGSVMSKYRT